MNACSSLETIFVNLHDSVNFSGKHNFLSLPFYTISQEKSAIMFVFMELFFFCLQHPPLHLRHLDERRA